MKYFWKLCDISLYLIIRFPSYLCSEEVSSIQIFHIAFSKDGIRFISRGIHSVHFSISFPVVSQTAETHIQRRRWSYFSLNDLSKWKNQKCFFFVFYFGRFVSYFHSNVLDSNDLWTYHFGYVDKSPNDTYQTKTNMQAKVLNWITLRFLHLIK